MVKRKHKRFQFLPILLSLLFLSGLAMAAPLSQPTGPGRQVAPVATGGVLDLRAWHFDRQGVVPLKGEWGFFWQQLLAPDDFSTTTFVPADNHFSVPAVWNGHLLDDERLSGKGYATFRLKVKLDPEVGSLGIRLPRIFSAYRLWVDDRLLAAAGRVGEDSHRARPAYRPTTVSFYPVADQVDITLQVANFSHAKGGLRMPPVLGSRAQITENGLRRMTREAVMFGFLLIMAVYHLALYMFRRQDLFNLYFSLVCLLIGLRTAFTGENIGNHIFGHLNWYLAVKLEWLCVYLAPSLTVGFFQEYFPHDSSDRVRRVAVATGGVLAVMVLVCPPLWFTAAFKYLTFVIGGLLVYSAAIMVRALLNRRPGAILVGVAYGVMFLLVLNDVLFANEVIKTGFYLPFGLLLFILVLSVQFSMRTSRALIKVEKQAVALAAANTAYRREIKERKRAQAALKAYQGRLEELVSERTDELEIANMLLREELSDRQKAEQEKQALQQQLQRAQKMEAIGTLAGGVAHDLNNILSGIVSYPELIMLDLPAESPLRKPIATIQKSGQKAAAIVQDLLTLARRGVAVTEVVNLNQIVGDYLNSPEYAKLKSFYPAIQVETRLADDLFNIVGSPVHLTKTIMNLMSNAMESMADGGAVVIRTDNRYIDRPVRGYDQVQEGDYVVFTIEDQGTGIAPEDIERIFEPFYTKKKMGKSGTGLGMAVVWGTVKDHQGYIDVSSTRVAGTVFTLYFPATRSEVAAAVSAVSMDQYMGQGESILVVDDVEEQREIACGILNKLGYRARAVSSGEKAVSSLQAEPADLVILDMIMDPGLNGLETYDRILADYPDQKAVIASGFSETEAVRQTQELGAGAYVKKPYTLEKLARAVQAELARENCAVGG